MGKDYDNLFEIDELLSGMLCDITNDMVCDDFDDIETFSKAAQIEYQGIYYKMELILTKIYDYECINGIIYDNLKNNCDNTRNKCKRYEWDDIMKAGLEFPYKNNTNNKEKNMNINDVVIEPTQELPKWKWTKLNVNKNMVKVHFTKDDNNSILVALRKDLEVWFDCKNVVVSPYLNTLIINVADGKKYKLANKETITGNQIISYLSQER